MKLTVTDDPNADLVICIKSTEPTPYTDNVRGVCSHCGVAIQWRPSVPDKPKKVCIECAAEAIAGDAEPELLITTTTMDELAEYAKKKQH